MKLTWKDGVATAIAALVVAVYVLFLSGADVVLVSSVRGAATAILLLGVIGCGYGAADELYKAPKSAAKLTYTVIATTLGIAALGGGLIALIFASEVGLAVLFGVTVALWSLATTRHITNTCRAPQVTGDVSELRKEETSL
ncbi:hypothetical protein DMH04_17660 [Kibdelosporangium aridum]|uniref:Uncharacterized protein n=1 Tax=Kibdelosporangium aridum TaxID=2030 RepID=A0A428ZAP5_KIBAR|nr:hypothetical protein [Kibdelosporangium aridum]RSM85135.1 hypothetical protein DMH04_17660 [Kibdelosporangium aridum]